MDVPTFLKRGAAVALCGALLGLVFAALAVHLCDRAGACRMQKSR